jgi:hypothetical protein
MGVLLWERVLALLGFLASETFSAIRNSSVYSIPPSMRQCAFVVIRSP